MVALAEQTAKDNAIAAVKNKNGLDFNVLKRMRNYMLALLLLRHCPWRYHCKPFTTSSICKEKTHETNSGNERIVRLKPISSFESSG